MSRIHNEYADEKMTYGRYRGTKLRDLPLNYLKWLIMNVSAQHEAQKFALELARRDESYS